MSADVTRFATVQSLLRALCTRGSESEIRYVG